MKKYCLFGVLALFSTTQTSYRSDVSGLGGSTDSTATAPSDVGVSHLGVSTGSVESDNVALNLSTLATASDDITGSLDMSSIATSGGFSAPSELGSHYTTGSAFQAPAHPTAVAYVVLVPTPAFQSMGSVPAAGMPAPVPVPIVTSGVGTSATPPAVPGMASGPAAPVPVLVIPQVSNVVRFPIIGSAAALCAWIAFKVTDSISK